MKEEFSDSWECTSDFSYFTAFRTEKNFKDNASENKTEVLANEETTRVLIGCVIRDFGSLLFYLLVECLYFIIGKMEVVSFTD